jgi:hypothetical protein
VVAAAAKPGVATAAGIVIGTSARGFFPPFALDDPFWRKAFSLAGGRARPDA